MFDVDVRNRGTMATNLFPSAAAWEVEVDGVWYGRKMELPPGVVEETPLKPREEAKAFAPDEEVKGWVTLRLDGKWLRGVRGEKRIRSAQAEETLPLLPGRHTIRVAYHPRAGFCPVSNALEIGALGAGEKDDPGWVRVRTEAEDKLLAFRPDGTGRTETAAGPAGRLPSPDGKSIVYAVAAGNESAVHVADADGKNARKVSPDGVVAAFPNWSPDGKRIAFLGTRGGKSQIHVMGRDVRPVTDADSAPHGAGLPKFDAGGRLAYLVYGERVGKRQLADLVVGAGKDARTLARGEVIADFAWSPDGKLIAYSKPGAVVFHDVASGKDQEVALKDIDTRLAGHAALDISWGPDSRAVACRMVFWGGRQANGPKMLGDEEVFVIPRTGKPTWFDAGGPVRHVEWFWDRPAEQPAGPPATTGPPPSAGDWSEPVDGLRGRLLVGQGRMIAELKARETLVYVELENVTHTPSGERAVYFDPQALRCKLAHADRNAAPEYPFGGSGGRGGPAAGWVTIPYDSLIRLRANPSGYGSPDGLHIALANGHYLLKTGDPGEYHLSGTLTVSPPAKHGRADAWAGRYGFRR